MLRFIYASFFRDVIIESHNKYVVVPNVNILCFSYVFMHFLLTFILSLALCFYKIVITYSIEREKKNHLVMIFKYTKEWRERLNLQNIYMDDEYMCNVKCYSTTPEGFKDNVYTVEKTHWEFTTDLLKENK